MYDGENGLIVTNAHVVKGSSWVKARLLLSLAVTPGLNGPLRPLLPAHSGEQNSPPNAPLGCAARPRR